MAVQQKNRRFTLRSAFGALTKSTSSLWKPALVAAPLIGAALFLATGTQAQTSGGARSPAPAANGTVAPIASPDAARRKGPKVKVKTATGRVANPVPAAGKAADAPFAPKASPEAARRKGVSTRPKVLDAQPNARKANPTPAADPVAQPSERRRRGPKVRDDSVSTRTGRPKERDPTPTND